MVDERRWYVLDSFALLGYFQDEPTAPRVQEMLREAATGRVNLFLCVINLAEILYRTERQHGAGSARDILAAIDQDLPIELVSADLALSVEAAHLKAAHPVSLADCYVAALAQQLGATVLTGDPDFARLEALVNVQWL